MAALLRHGARRVGVSAVQRTRAAFTTPVVAAQERRLLNTEVPPAIKTLINGNKVLTADEVHTISRAEIERLNELGFKLRPTGAPVSATAAKKKYQFTTQTSARILVLAFVICPLVLRAVTKDRGSKE